MRGRPRGRLSPRDHKIAINKAFRHYEILSGKPTPPGLMHEIKPLRKRSAPTPGRRLEKDVLAEALAMLRADPRVAMVERQQSGVFVEGNRHIRVGSRGALDIKGFLHGGRYFELEAKRPGQKPDERQAERIAAIKANGGIAGYFTSGAEALALLP
jgi:hypothetical protein